MNAVPINCPNCEAEISIPAGAKRTACDGCKTLLNVDSQFAFLRALDAFEEGQQLFNAVSPRRRRSFKHQQDLQAVELFKEAYSSMQLAFQGELVENQRHLGVEMMASMSQEFSMRVMVSGLEASYWLTLAVEQTAQNEYDRIKEQLSLPNKSPLGILTRWRWRMRQNQLRGELQKLDLKITSIERQIAFIEVPRARNRKWQP